jgi:hypothetical protein
MNDPRLAGSYDSLTEDEVRDMVRAMYRDGASVRAIMGSHPRLSYRRVRGILASAGELRNNHGWRAIGKVT